MEPVWTWSGMFVGYREGDDVWSRTGEHIGRCNGLEIFGFEGEYLGEVDRDRLIRVSVKRNWVSSPFIKLAPRGRLPRRKDKSPLVFQSSFVDFPCPHRRRARRTTFGGVAEVPTNVTSRT